VRILRDKVQEIIDTFNLLSPENQNTLLECASNAFNAERSVKKTADDELEHEEKTSEERQ